MGLRCLLGHDFTEPTTEREREERGDEVIVAVRRVKECERCGERRVISENKEVTTLDQPLGRESDDASTRSRDAGAAADPTPDDRDAGGASTGGWAERDSPVAEAEGGEFDHPEADLNGVDTSVENDAEIIRSGPSDAGTPDDADGRGRGEWPDADVNGSTGAAGREAATPGSSGSSNPLTNDSGGADGADGADGANTPGDATGGVGADDGPTTDPADGDAEFIDADAEAGVTGGNDDDDDRVPWPDHDGADEGFDATFGGDDDPAGDAPDTAKEATERDAGGEYIETESEPLDDAGSGGSWGAMGGSGGSDRSDRSERANGTRSGADRGSAGDASGSTVPGVELRTRSDDPDAEYVCPECGASEPVGASSTRAGDICPECKRGYIEERELD